MGRLQASPGTSVLQAPCPRGAARPSRPPARAGPRGLGLGLAGGSGARGAAAHSAGPRWAGPAGKAPAFPPITARSNLPRAHQPPWRPAPAGAGANRGGSHSASANQPSLLASLSSPRLNQSKSAAIIRFQPPGSPPIAVGAVSDGQSAPLLPRRHLCGGAAAAGRRDDGGGGGRWRVRHFRCQVAAAAERSGGRGRAWGCGRRRPPRRPRGHG